MPAEPAAPAADPPKRVPLVTYLALEPEPHLLVWECSACAARFFDRRNACAACGRAAAPAKTAGTTEAPAAPAKTAVPAGTTALASFIRKSVSTTGRLRAFSIVHRASPKIKVPFVAAVVEADDGTMIRSNLLVEPDPEQITFPMRVRLDTYPVGTDSQGSECVAFGFAPLQASREEDGQSSHQESSQGSETSESGQSEKPKSIPSIPDIPTVPQDPQAPQGAA